MAPLQDIVAKGVTEFAPPPTTSYRYVIELKSDKMSIWMEDRATKKQWYKGDMTKDDYVSSANAIPDAPKADYVQCFQDSLNCDLDDASDVQRKLIPLKGGALRLALAVTIRVLRSNWVAKYTFDLDPVSVERIDVLESKLRDLQDELERLHGEFDARQVLPSIQLTASSNNASTNLIWNMVESDDFSVSEDGAVKIHRPGLYNIAAVVNCAASSYNQTASLVKNGECVQTINCHYSSGYQSSATLNTNSRLEQDDQLTITCINNARSTSYLSIVQLGR